MKLLAIGSLKFAKLKRRLKLSQWQTIGVLEAIWLFTQHNAPDGAIGRHCNDDIAAWCEWDGDADDLIDSLVFSGWLDECQDNRLVVHDWAEHCPTFIKGNFSKHGREFAKHAPKQGTKHAAKHAAKQGASDGADPTLQATTLCNVMLPNVEKPNVEKEKVRERTIFVRPSVEQVSQYCEASGHRIDSAAFCDHYDSVGWKIGNKPMKDWQAAVRNWARRSAAQSHASRCPTDEDLANWNPVDGGLGRG